MDRLDQAITKHFWHQCGRRLLTFGAHSEDLLNKRLKEKPYKYDCSVFSSAVIQYRKLRKRNTNTSAVTARGSCWCMNFNNCWLLCCFFFLPKLLIASCMHLLELKRLLLPAGETSHTQQEITSLLSMSSMPSGKPAQTPQASVSAPISDQTKHTGNMFLVFFLMEQSLLAFDS